VCRSFAGRCPRDQGPPAVLGASRLFVLLVAARQWVLAGNNIYSAYTLFFLFFPLSAYPKPRTAFLEEREDDEDLSMEYDDSTCLS